MNKWINVFGLLGLRNTADYNWIKTIFYVYVDATSKSLRNDKYPQATDVFTEVKVVDELNNGDNLTEIHSVVQDYGKIIIYWNTLYNYIIIG